MGRTIIVIGFLITLSLSLWVYFNLDRRSIQSQIGQDIVAHPRLTIKDFTIFQYDSHTLKRTTSGKLGYFLEPNTLEVFGDIRALQHNSEKHEYLFADSMIAYFNSQGISNLMKDSSISTMELENNVNLGTSRNLLKTEYAKYSAKTKTLTSDLPVRVENSSGQVDGEAGFEYHTESEKLVIFGPMKGVLQSGKKKKK